MLMGPLKASKKLRVDKLRDADDGMVDALADAQQAAVSSLPAADEARWFASALAEAEDAESVDAIDLAEEPAAA